MSTKIEIFFKVHIFWEGHNILQIFNFNLLLSYVVPVKSKVKISQNLVAFSECINFKISQNFWTLIGQINKVLYPTCGSNLRGESM